MANNRLALVCKECMEGAYLAKYYPSQGWWTSHNADYEDYMNAFLEKHTHGKSMWSAQEFTIGYEMENDTSFSWFEKEVKDGNI